MIIKCQYCKKEFDKPSRKNQHEKDAHMQGAKRLESLGVIVGATPSTPVATIKEQ